MNSYGVKTNHEQVLTLEKLDVRSVAKVPRDHGAEAPSEPPAAALIFETAPVLNNGGV